MAAILGNGVPHLLKCDVVGALNTSRGGLAYVPSKWSLALASSAIVITPQVKRRWDRRGSIGWHRWNIVAWQGLEAARAQSPAVLDHRRAITWVTGTSPYEAVEASPPGIAAASPCGADRSIQREKPVGSDAHRDQRLNHALPRRSANNEDT